MFYFLLSIYLLIYLYNDISKRQTRRCPRYHSHLRIVVVIYVASLLDIYVPSAFWKHRRTAARDGINKRNVCKTVWTLKYLCPGSKHNLNATQSSHFNAYLFSRTSFRFEFWSRASRLFLPQFTCARGLPKHKYALKCEHSVAFEFRARTERTRTVYTTIWKSCVYLFHRGPCAETWRRVVGDSEIVGDTNMWEQRTTSVRFHCSVPCYANLQRLGYSL